MARVFLFAEQIRSIVRSGEKEIKIAEGTRISSAAADLIKEHRLRIITVAPAEAASSVDTDEGAIATTIAGANTVNDKPASTQGKLKRHSSGKTSNKTALKDQSSPAAPGNIQEIDEGDLDAIVDRVLKRFQQLKAEQAPKKPGITKTVAAGVAKTAEKTEAASDNLDDLVICRCEEITRGEIKAAIRNGMQTLNGLKRVTRAGMGLCQGQTCQRLVAQILTQELGISPARIDPTTARGPVRPLRLGVFANN